MSFSAQGANLPRYEDEDDVKDRKFAYRRELDKIVSNKTNDVEQQKMNDYKMIQDLHMTNQKAIEQEKNQRFAIKIQQNEFIARDLDDFKQRVATLKKQKEDENLILQEKYKFLKFQEEEEKKVQKQMREVMYQNLRESHTQQQSLKQNQRLLEKAEDQNFSSKQLEVIDKLTEQRNAFLNKIRGGWAQNQIVANSYENLYNDLKKKNDYLHYVTVEKPAIERQIIESERLKAENLMKKQVYQQNLNDIKRQAEEYKKSKLIEQRKEKELEYEMMQKRVEQMERNERMLLAHKKQIGQEMKQSLDHQIKTSRTFNINKPEAAKNLSTQESQNYSFLPGMQIGEDRKKQLRVVDKALNRGEAQVRSSMNRNNSFAALGQQTLISNSISDSGSYKNKQPLYPDDQYYKRSNIIQSDTDRISSQADQEYNDQKKMEYEFFKNKNQFGMTKSVLIQY